MPEGALKGLQYFSHRGSANDKTMKLPSRNTSIRPDNGLHRIVNDPEDDWSTYKLLNFMIKNHLPEGWTGFLFVRPASPKSMDQRLAAGLKFTGNDGPTGKYIKNQPTLIFRILAHRCGFDNPDRFTGRSARRTGLSNTAKAGTPFMTSLAKGRHTGTAVHAAYIDLDTSMQQTALKEKEKKKKKAKDAKMKAGKCSSCLYIPSVLLLFVTNHFSSVIGMDTGATWAPQAHPQMPFYQHNQMQHQMHPMQMHPMQMQQMQMQHPMQMQQMQHPMQMQ
jgi:hypothetical protein